MSKSNNGGINLLLMIIIHAIAWIGAGIITWNWIEPDSFGRTILFLVAWSILGYIAQIIGGLIYAVTATMIK